MALKPKKTNKLTSQLTNPPSAEFLGATWIKLNIMDSSGNGLLAFVILMTLIMLSPAIILFIVGLSKRKSKPETAKVLFIASAVYVLIGAGICGALLSQ